MDISRIQPYLNIKAFVTAVFTVVTALMFWEGKVIPDTLMIINTVVIIDYFRSSENKSNVAMLTSMPVQQAQQAPLAQPWAESIDGPAPR